MKRPCLEHVHKELFTDALIQLEGRTPSQIVSLWLVTLFFFKDSFMSRWSCMTLVLLRHAFFLLAHPCVEFKLDRWVSKELNPLAHYRTAWPFMDLGRSKKTTKKNR